MVEVILALDLPSPDASLRLLDRIPEVRWVKLGPVLMNHEGGGHGLVRQLVGRGIEVFLDQKWHDIPNTVRGAAVTARDLGVRMATVHALGGHKMVSAAVDGAFNGGTAGQEPSLGIVAVTVLTSHDLSSYGDAIGRRPDNLTVEARRLAAGAMRAGARGVVCSPLEVEAVAEVVAVEGGGWVVVPGIRRDGDHAGDQSRTADPAEVARKGATHLVVGRPILESSDPRSTYLQFLEAVR